MIEKIKKIIETCYDRSDYPTLEFQRCQWSVTKPLAGLRVLDATPVFRNTLSKYIPLMEAGAELAVGLSEVMPCDKKIVAFLRQAGIRIVTPNDKGETFDVILDCAAAFASHEARIGYVELTRSGVKGYMDCQKPVYVADSSRIKRIETSLGTGESYFRAMAQLGYTDWKGKRLVIFGNGKVGSGLAIYGHQHSAHVSVFDENSPQDSVVSAIREAYAVVTATGVKNALESYASELQNSVALLANMGVEDEFSEKVSLERVLSAKRPINFMLEEPTHLRYIETTMALHNHGALEIMKNRDHQGFLYPTEEVENEFLRIVEQKGKIKAELKTIQ